MTVGSNERVNCANDCIDSNSKPQKDEADAWPTLREAGKESLQRMPPRGTKRASKRLASFAANWTPRTSAFSVPLGNSRALGSVGKTSHHGVTDPDALTVG
jgi:hypothetical protein